MKDFRCIKCNKLLGKIDGNAEIKCSRCGTTNVLDGDRHSIRAKIENK